MRSGASCRDSSRARCSDVGLVVCKQRPPLPGIDRRSTTLHNISERRSACANLDAVKLLQAAGHRVGDRLGRDSRSAARLRPLYERALYWSTLGRGIAWPINGVEYRIDPRHRHRLGQDYDPPVARFLAGRIRPGATCVDVGANVGAYVLQLAHWSRPQGRVIAFEPNASARRVLNRHLRMNEIDRRVTVVPSALSHTQGTAMFFFRSCTRNEPPGQAQSGDSRPGGGSASASLDARRIRRGDRDCA